MRKQLRDYARLIAVCGANVQKGQEVVIRAEPDQPEFVAAVCEECYRLGASSVSVDWEYTPVTKLHIQYRSLKTLSSMQKWEKEKLAYRAKTLPAMILIKSSDPDGLNGIDDVKNSKASQARYPIIKPYLDQMENKYQWTIAAVPGKAWAKKVFPNETPSKAVSMLWDAILKAARAEKDPIGAWKKHNAELAERCAHLNSLGLSELIYKSRNGTDFRVGLIEQSVFCGGSETSLKNVVFNPNIPSEEIFISPKRGVAEGTVVATKPLSYRGRLIENFSFTFKGGKVVDFKAEKGADLLGTMLSMDEGASYLGECALIPFDSPISNSGIIFYNTLFDENASCHLALGHGFTNTIRDYEKYTLEECRKLGVNDSMMHEDFMIGTEDMDIKGKTRGGKTVQIFKNGNFVF